MPAGTVSKGQVPRFTFHVGALIGIRASVCPVTGQIISGTGPQAARNTTNQGNYRGRNEVTAQQRGSCRGRATTGKC